MFRGREMYTIPYREFFVGGWRRWIRPHLFHHWWIGVSLDPLSHVLRWKAFRGSKLTPPEKVSGGFWKTRVWLICGIYTSLLWSEYHPWFKWAVTKGPWLFSSCRGLYYPVKDYNMPMKGSLWTDLKSSTLPKTNIAPENDVSNRNFLFQWSIFRGYVSFREGRYLQSSPCFSYPFPKVPKKP